MRVSNSSLSAFSSGYGYVYRKTVRLLKGESKMLLEHALKNTGQKPLVGSFDPAALQKSLDDLSQFQMPIRIGEFNFPGQRSKYYAGDRRTVMPPQEARP